MRDVGQRLLTIGLLLSLLLVGLGEARASGELRPDAPLKVIKTEHFRIVFDPRESSREALEVAANIEEVRETLLKSLGLEVSYRYTVLLIDSYDYANGSASGYPSRVIRLYLTPPGPPAAGSSDISDSIGETWFREVLTHEYTHAAHLNWFTGWTPVFKWLFHGQPFQLIYPNWFIEGFAVTQETALSPAGRGRTATSDMILRTEVLNHALLPMGAWGFVDGWPGGGSSYLHGGMFLYYVHERFGEDALPKVVNATNTQLPFLDDVRLTFLASLVEDLGGSGEKLKEKRLGGLERGFQLALGAPLSQIHKDWQEMLQTRYYAQREAIVAAGETRATALTALGGGTLSPAVTASGNIYFLAQGDADVASLSVVSLSGGRPRTLLERSGMDGVLAVSPDESKVVYGRFVRRNRPLERSTTWSDLFVYDVQRDRERRLTSGKRLTDPCFTPDGKALVAVARRGSGTVLVRLSPDGSNLTDLFHPPRGYQLASPVVSPDGSNVAMSVLIQQEPPQRSLYVIGVLDLTSRELRIVPGEGVNREPAWLDNERLLFSSDRSGVYNLVLADLKTGKEEALTNLMTGAFQPRAIPGEVPWVVFRGYSERGFDIYRLEPSEEELNVLRGAGGGRAVAQLRSSSAEKSEPVGEPLSAQPISPEEAGVVALPDYPQVASQPYRLVSGLTLTRLAPTIGHDEGAQSRAYTSGSTVGVEASVGEPLDRLDLYGQVDYGLLSEEVNYSATLLHKGFGFPLAVYGVGKANAVDILEEEDNYFLLWQRGHWQGVALELPFSQGMTGLALSLGGEVGQFRQFYALDPEGVAGSSREVSLTLSMSRGQSNAWRSPAQGQFYQIGSSWSDQTLLQEEGEELTKRWQTWGEVTFRKWLGEGTLDMDLMAGHREGLEYQYLVGGYTGRWAIPGVPLRSAAKVDTAGLLRLTLTQDIFKPEFAIGRVPMLYLSKVELGLSYGAATGLLSGNLVVPVQGLAISLEAQVQSLRRGLGIFPRFTTGVDLMTGQVTWWLSLGVLPDMSGTFGHSVAPGAYSEEVLQETWGRPRP